MLDSVRALQKAGGLEKVSEQLGVNGSEWASSGSASAPSSFSESVRVFDPGKLKAVVRQLAGELQGQLNPVNADPRLKQHLAGKPLTMADGTVLTVPGAIATVAQATWLRFQGGTAKHARKLHPPAPAAGLRHPPARRGGVELTDARNSGESDEKFVLRKHLRRDCCYVTDRWFGQFTLFNDIHRLGSSYVCRVKGVKENSAFE
jgi:hypothetical protein